MSDMKRAKQIPLRFKAGDRVFILDLDKAGHVRTPSYVRGKIGEIADFRGYFLNPEQLSVGDTAGPVIPLYRVEFRMQDLWPEYRRDRPDVLSIEVYDHWMAPVADDEARPSTNKGDRIGAN
jgi:hypothetical protein